MSDSDSVSAGSAVEPGSVAERVRAAVAGRPAGERRVIDTLLGSGTEAIHLTVSEVAKTSGVGVGTVVRACQSIGFKGFQDAKISLAQDRVHAAVSVQHNVDADDTPAMILRKLAASTKEALQSAPTNISDQELGRAVDVLAGARRILLLAVGTSTPFAYDAAYRLTTIGLDARAPADVHAQHLQASLLTAADAVVVVSHTGATTETIAAANAAANVGATVIAVTSFSTTPLTDIAAISLVAGGRETAYRVEAMTSRFSHLLILDSLYVALYLRDPERSRAAQEHVLNVLAEHRF